MTTPPPAPPAQIVLQNTRPLTFKLADGYALTGELSLPPGAKPGQKFRTVILLHGSGPNDLNETLPEQVSGVPGGSKVFLQLARQLNEAGFAVVRYNKRGVLGAVPRIDPAARPEQATVSQFSADALGVLQTVRTLPEVNPGEVFLLGHSEGTMLAARIARDPRILDLVEGVLGPDLLVWSAEFFIKEPRTTHVVGMHQDLTYWGMGETPDQVTAWLALSPATVESGCMDFVAGSHKNPILPHTDTYSEHNLLSRGQEIAVDVAETDKTHIELAPGQMSLHHGLTIHGSGPNRSDDRRIGMAIRYLNPNARQLVAERDYAMPARGTDSSGNFIPVEAPARLFAPEALALYERIRADQAKALAQGASSAVPLYQTTG